MKKLIKKNILFLLWMVLLLNGACLLRGTETGNSNLEAGCMAIYKNQAVTSQDLPDVSLLLCNRLSNCEVEKFAICEEALLQGDSTLLAEIFNLNTQGFYTASDIETGLNSGALNVDLMAWEACESSLNALACESLQGTLLEDAATFGWLPVECEGLFNKADMDVPLGPAGSNCS